MDHRGAVVAPLDKTEVRRLAEALKDQDIEAVVIAYLHAYVNPDHEEQTAAIFRDVSPRWEVVTSSSVSREYYEFERTSTAAVQGYLQPLVARYAKNLERRLAERKFTVPTFVMQSNGGLAPLNSYRPAPRGSCGRAQPRASWRRRGWRDKRASRTSSPATWAAPATTSPSS